jgi:hypothetical protein
MEISLVDLSQPLHSKQQKWHPEVTWPEELGHG